MPVVKLESTTAFLAHDLAGVDRAFGVARLAPKVLVDGAQLLARATTYTFAAYHVRAGGVSAGIDATPDTRDAAVAAFVEEVARLAADGRVHLSPGLGLSADDLEGLGCEPLDESLTARGAVAAAAAYVGGGTAAVVGSPTWVDRVAPWWADAGGGEVVDGGTDTDADVVFLAGRVGIVDHDTAAGVRARALVALTPVPVTAKAYAVLHRAGVVFVPDAVSCAAPLLALADPDGGDPVARVGDLAAELRPSGVDTWRAMVERAEAFLRDWRGEVPFGRPLA